MLRQERWLYDQSINHCLFRCANFYLVRFSYGIFYFICHRTTKYWRNFESVLWLLYSFLQGLEVSISMKTATDGITRLSTLAFVMGLVIVTSGCPPSLSHKSQLEVLLSSRTDWQLSPHPLYWFPLPLQYPLQHSSFYPSRRSRLSQQ
jgi:hypothetical protein